MSSWNGIPATFYLDNVQLVGAAANPGQPLLSLYNDGRQLRLWWPAEFSGFTLQAAPGPGGPWEDAGAVVSATNCQWSATLTPTNTQQFYRIAAPGK